MLKKTMITIITLLLPIIILLTSVQVMVQWDGFYYREYKTNSVIDNTNIEIDDLMNITDEMQKYLFGQRDDFKIYGIVNGEETQVFYDREIVHMEDVKELFNYGLMIRNIGGIVLLVLLFFLYKRDKKSLLKSFRYSSIGFFIISGIIGFLFYTDFNKYFVIFHEIFFKNEFWVLDPTDSILINMVPLNFFIHMVIGILAISMLSMLIIGIIGFKNKIGGTSGD